MLIARCPAPKSWKHPCNLAAVTRGLSHSLISSAASGSEESNYHSNISWTTSSKNPRTRHWWQAVPSGKHIGYKAAPLVAHPLLKPRRRQPLSASIHRSCSESIWSALALKLAQPGRGSRRSSSPRPRLAHLAGTTWCHHGSVPVPKHLPSFLCGGSSGRTGHVPPRVWNNKRRFVHYHFVTEVWAKHVLAGFQVPEGKFMNTESLWIVCVISGPALFFHFFHSKTCKNKQSSSEQKAFSQRSLARFLPWTVSFAPGSWLPRLRLLLPPLSSVTNNHRHSFRKEPSE